MSASNSSKGKSPSIMSSVRAILSKASGNSNLQESMHTVQEDVTHVEEPQERSTVLTRVASSRPNPLADLESLLPVRHSFDDEEGMIALCNELLVLNFQEHRDPTRRTIKIPGTTGVFISPNQFYHAWHLLSQGGRDLNGGILADEAGTGKTTVYFVAALLRSLAYESQRLVRTYWRSGKGKKKVGRQAEHHLPEGANGRSCPSQKHGGIVCYCVPGSLTRTICDHTPSGVSALYVPTEIWPDILNMVQTAGLNPSMYQLCLVHNNAPTRFTRPLQPLVQALSHGAEPDLKAASPASYIFITTLESPRLRNVFSATLRAGFVVVDEAHQILRAKDSLTFRMVSEFSDNGADVWFVTATPFSGCTLASWVPAMKLIAPRRAAATRALASALETAKSSRHDADVLSFQAHFHVVFDRDLVVRHFGTSKFFGKPISDVQDIVPKVISRDTPLRHMSAVQELANQIAYRDAQLRDSSQRGLLYLVSLFPAAAQLILDDPIIFDTASIRDLVRQVKNRLRIEESDPLGRLTDQIIKGSPKLEYILQELNRMDQDDRERARLDNQNTSRFGPGEDLKMKKMVIITPTVVSAIFLYLALIRHRPDVSLIHNWVSAQEKEQVVNNFKSLSAAKLVKHNRILIAPFAAIGTGANLQVASYQILTSPLPDRASQVQAFARTNRSGQRLRPLSHKVLVLEDSPVDRIVLTSHATLDIESDPFNISEPLRIAGSTALGSVNNLENPDSPTGAVEDHLSSTHGSTLGVDEALIFQNSLPFFPRPPTGDGSQERDRGSEIRLSSTDASEALQLQNALFWAPGSDTEDDIQSTTEAHGQYSLFNGSSHGSSSHSSTTGRPGEPARSMSAVLESDRSSGTHRQLTYTPAPRQSSIPTHHDLGHRPLPPLPNDAQLDRPNDGQSRTGLSLFPPLASGPPARVDVGPSLTSNQDPFASTPERNRLTILTVNDDDDASFSSAFDNDPIDRPPTPYPDEMREHEVEDNEQGWGLGHMDFDVDNLIRMARASTLHLANNRFEQDEQDVETLD